MSKYITLIKILDELRKEAPSEYRRYYPRDNDTEALNNARSRAYIHLYLKVKFGLLTFEERESLITDDTDDAGIDAYFIDTEAKHIYFIQSKFRNTEENFEAKNIELDELISMELDRITKGENKYSNGNPYNNKIQVLIQKIHKIEDYPKYTEKVILLANLKDKYRDKIKQLTLFSTEIYDYERCYNELVFPVVSGTFFNPKELKIAININSNSNGSRIDYYVDTDIEECNITAIFVPTVEVAKILYKYKNSILKYNPRSYLDLASGSVNKKIKSSIVDISTNEFALYNNGITMFSDKTFYKDRVGKKSEAELIVTNPQIINGGQTAFTLSRIYEDCLKGTYPDEIFDNKEVLLKVITFVEDEEGIIQENSKLNLIESISKATNDQTEVTEADRRSNEKIQIEIQGLLFETFGYFYERKKGEFGDGLRNKYIDRSKIIERESFLRICLSVNGNPSQARRASSKTLFKKDSFQLTLINKLYTSKYFIGYKTFLYLQEIQKKYDKDINNKFGQAQFGFGLRYGKFALINSIVNSIKEEINVENYNSLIEKYSADILQEWIEFEEYVRDKKSNSSYFKKYKDPETGQEIVEINFDNYYKGRTINEDLKSYFNP